MLLVPKRGNSNRIVSNRITSNRLPPTNENNNSNSRRQAGLSSGDGNTGVNGATVVVGGTNNCWGGSDYVVISCKVSGAGLS